MIFGDVMKIVHLFAIWMISSTGDVKKKKGIKPLTHIFTKIQVRE